MKDFLKEIIEGEEIVNWHLIIFLSLLSLILVVVSHNYIFTREFYDLIYSKKFDATLIDFLYITKVKFAIWKYLAVPLVVVLRVFFVALLIQFSLMIRIIEVPFNKIVRLSLLGFAVLSLVSISQVVYLLTTPMDSFTEKSINLVPFSLATLLNVNNSSPSLISIFGVINIFEILWINVIAFGLKVIANLSSLNSFITSFSVWCIILLFQSGVILFISKLLS